MSNKRKNDWPALVRAFEASGLTQTKFCEQHNLNPKYFSLKRSKLLAASNSPAFQKVAVEKKRPATTPLIITIGRCQIQCPASMPIQQVAALVQGLA